MNIRIPECGEHPNCPKCHCPVGEFGSVRFHPEAVRRYDTDLAGEEPCGALLYAAGDDFELKTALDKGHLCKKCRFCGFGWVEKTFSEEDLYALREEDDDGEGS